jgi:succinate dehydrogenase / fumarate reductase flavoprotein subunit
MFDPVIVDGKARGILARNFLTAGEIERHSAHAVVIAQEDMENVSCQLMAMEVTLQQLGKYTRKGLLFANPCYTHHPTCIPASRRRLHQSKLTYDVRTRRNDGRICSCKLRMLRQSVKERKPTELSEEDRDYYLERRYPSFGNLVLVMLLLNAAKERSDAGFGVNQNRRGSLFRSCSCNTALRKRTGT